LSCEHDAAILLIHDQPIGIEPLNHGGHAGGCDLQSGGDIRDAGIALAANQAMNLLQVILGGCGTGLKIGHGARMFGRR
jgi:hypothetical protein